ncbi:transposase [Bacillus sp. TH22]|uniref:transposase n=1 Tax=unclassified Bacillus (in: firmicutes) TaxID=185979 RepID=UPI001913D22F|nr:MULTISPECIES: transposase [unclassified Bacillus (in: firmicutes)]MBK5358619.1 transposase [Bacillus sp. TH44]MBK5350652.1 transposase [Bacillus sp. TH45]MBK5362905.1 transposase [Bacillus sp. TH50]MBK5451971.1 transposase [Bacillus sp. TH22]MBK5454292.1 transposase [Bacillus sp. TH23]
MKLDSNNHSVFSLYYHLVLVVKYRRNVFDDDMSDYAKDMFWSRSFCLLTTGGSPIDAVKKYIEN